MWNPVRRNRNIGTSNQGFGSNNKLDISYPLLGSKGFRDFYERLGPYEKIEKIINGHSFIFVIEAPRKSCTHACSVQDVERIIENIPSSHYGSLKLIIFRQPKRKEEIISSVWGRLIYSYTFEDDYFPAIILEAVDCDKKIYFKKSQAPEDEKEFKRLISDGHQFVENKRNFISHLDPGSVRNTQLYRTLPHEFGHYVQYQKIVGDLKDEEDLEDWEKRNETYLQIPKSDKENYAHRYANDLIEKLKKVKVIPFDRI